MVESQVWPSVTKTTLVYFRCGDLERPAVKVEEREDGDVTIIIRSEPDEHLSLHSADDGILLTHYAPNLAFSTHDAARVAAARAHGYWNPGRHRSYAAHWALRSHVVGMDGHYLVGRRIYLDRANAKAKYDNLSRIVIDAPASEFMVTFILSTPARRRPLLPHRAGVNARR
jgi:hypothetical protein